MQVNMLEAKNQLSKLVKAALAGEVVVIANHGVPAVRLVAMDAAVDAPSLADAFGGLRALLADEGAVLETPPRSDRDHPFDTGAFDTSAFDADD
jgi:prevent-host-death family protein